MSKGLNCMNCCIGDFKHSLCDCDNGMCKEYKKVGRAEDFENEVMNRTKPKTGKWVRLEREENIYDIHGVPTWGVNYMCDKCGFITTAIQDHFAQYKWCPSCGSYNGGEKE